MIPFSIFSGLTPRQLRLLDKGLNPLTELRPRVHPPLRLAIRRARRVQRLRPLTPLPRGQKP